MVKSVALGIAAASLGCCIAVPAAKAQTESREVTSAELFDALAACKRVAAPAERLACYDAASSRLAEAVDRKDLVVLDRAEIRRTRRSLFGMSLPRMPLFRGEDGEEATELTARIASASSLGMGKWQFRLEDGAVWQTLESKPGLRDPKAGQEVVIKKGTLGNYFIRFNGQMGVRGQRQR
jgi:hypothetical protein